MGFSIQRPCRPQPDGGRGSEGAGMAERDGSGTGVDPRDDGPGWRDWLQAGLGLALSCAIATALLALGYWWLTAGGSS